MTRAQVTVRYDSSGGTRVSDGLAVTPDANGVICFQHPRVEPVRSGARFLGWLCEDDPTYYGLDSAGQTVRYKLSGGQLRYVAQWMPDVHPSHAPYMMATALRPDGNVYDVLEGRWTCIQQSQNTYYALHSWYNGQPGYSGIVDGSGYAGFQAKDGRTWAILSVWGNNHGVPSIQYARPDSAAEPFDGEGSGVHVLTEYPWRVNTCYTMRIQARSDRSFTRYEQWVRPEGEAWEMLAVISFPRPNLGFTWDCFFMEDWSGNNLPRSCRIAGYYARRMDGRLWRSLSGFEISNHIVGSDERNVQYDCDFRRCARSFLWIQSGGDGYDRKAPPIPGAISLAQDRTPAEAGLLG